MSQGVWRTWAADRMVSFALHPREAYKHLISLMFVVSLCHVYERSPVLLAHTDITSFISLPTLTLLNCPFGLVWNNRNNTETGYGLENIAKMTRMMEHDVDTGAVASQVRLFLACVN